MGLIIFRRYALRLAVIGGLACGLGTRMHGQVSPTTSKSAQEHNTSANRTRPKMYEDDEVKILIPLGWVVPNKDHPAVGAYQEAGSSMTEAKRKLMLAKNSYTLALAFDTEHASGIVGGRFIEVLRIPWLNAEQASICSQYFSAQPQPVSKAVILINLILNTGDSKVRDNCHIPKDLGYLTDQVETNSLVGQQRWFAGYFTTADGSVFFQSKGDGCGQKAYTLTSKAKTSEELPVTGDPDLRATIKEARGIVDSIHYKRCPPASAF